MGDAEVMVVFDQIAEKIISAIETNTDTQMSNNAALVEIVVRLENIAKEVARLASITQTGLTSED